MKKEVKKKEVKLSDVKVQAVSKSVIANKPVVESVKVVSKEVVKEISAPKLLKEIQYINGVARHGAKRVVQVLREIYGIGAIKSRQVCEACGVLQSTRIGQLEPNQVKGIENYINQFLVTGSDRRKKEVQSIKRHRDLGTQRGIRIRSGLPVRGQRTKTNGFTARKLNPNRGKIAS